LEYTLILARELTTGLTQPVHSHIAWGEDMRHIQRGWRDTDPGGPPRTSTDEALPLATQCTAGSEPGLGFDPGGKVPLQDRFDLGRGHQLGLTWAWSTAPA